MRLGGKDSGMLESMRSQASANLDRIAGAILRMAKPIAVTSTTPMIKRLMALPPSSVHHDST